jgi:hypothetical protein
VGPGGDHHGGTLSGQSLRDRPPDSAAATGHQSRFTGK